MYALATFLLRGSGSFNDALILFLQPIECKAAIAWEAEKPLDVTTVIVGPPQKGEVRVKVRQALF